MTSREPFHVSTSDRRRAKRQPAGGKVTIRIETEELEGTANNVSRSGVLFFTDSELKVTVEVEHEGEVQTRLGNLVRCERIKGDHRGWAVEFDQE